MLWPSGGGEWVWTHGVAYSSQWGGAYPHPLAGLCGLAARPEVRERPCIVGGAQLAPGAIPYYPEVRVWEACGVVLERIRWWHWHWDNINHVPLCFWRGF